MPATTPAPTTCELVFVVVEEDRIVLDVLHSLHDAALGEPRTWTFELPHDPVLQAAVVARLSRWCDDGARVAIEIRRPTGARPSVAFTDGATLVRLSVVPVRSDGRTSSTS